MKLISLRNSALLAISASLFSFNGVVAAAESSPAAPIVMTGADRRPAQSLNGDWHVIPDPYQTGLYDFHKHEIARGWFVNQKAKPGDTGPVDYDFSKAETLKVPGDWNTQKREFFWYEGLMWYEKDFNFEPKEHTRTFLPFGCGAAWKGRWS